MTNLNTEVQVALDSGIVEMMENWATSQSEYRYIHAVIEVARLVADHQMIPTSIVEDFLYSLTETEAGPDEWPEYQALLAALTPGDNSDISTGISAPEVTVVDDEVVALTPGATDE